MLNYFEAKIHKDQNYGRGVKFQVTTIVGTKTAKQSVIIEYDQLVVEGFLDIFMNDLKEQIKKCIKEGFNHG